MQNADLLISQQRTMDGILVLLVDQGIRKEEVYMRAVFCHDIRRDRFYAVGTHQTLEVLLQIGIGKSTTDLQGLFLLRQTGNRTLL